MSRFKIFITLLFFSLGATAQIPGFQPIRGKTQYIDSFGLYKYKNNPAMDSMLTTDTLGRIKLKYFPGGGGSGTVTNFSASNLSPLFTSSVANPTSTPAITFSLSNTSQYKIFGRKASGSGAPSYLDADSSLIPGLHSESYYNTKYLGIGYTPPSTSLSQLVPALGTNTIDNGNFKQEWQANTLAGNTFFKLSTASTVAAGNLQRVFEIDMTGTNATVGQTTYGAYIRNRHAGSGFNIGLYSEAVNGFFNTAIVGQGGGGTGVSGLSSNGKGVSGSVSGSGYGVHGQGGSNGYSGYFTNNSAAGGHSLYAESVGSTTTNTAAEFKAINGSVYNVAVYVPSGGGSVGIGTSTPDSLLTVNEGSWFKRGARFSGIPESKKSFVAFLDSAGTLYRVDTTGLFSGGGGSSVVVSDSAWSLTGNAGTDTSVNFIGTTDHMPLMIKVDNTVSGFIGTGASGEPSSGNVGFGNYVLNAGKNTGFRNVAIGDGTMGNSTTAEDNTAVGAAAMASTLFSTYNTAIGKNSMVSLDSGTANTALGHSSIGNITSGSYNIGLGYQAGRYNTTESNRLYISSTDWGNHANDSTGSIVYGIQHLTTPSSQKLFLNAQLYAPYLSSGVANKRVMYNSTTKQFVVSDSTAADANVTLSNLSSPTAVNQSILPGTDNSVDLGSGTKQWRNGIFGTGLTIGAAAAPSIGKLEIFTGGGAGGGLTLKNTAAGAYSTMDFHNDGGFNGQFLFTGSTYSNNFFTGNQLAFANYHTTGNVGFVAAGGSGFIKFATGGFLNANERVRITSAGNVGIGTTSPGSLFTVGANAFTVNSSGVVGAGTWNGTVVGTQYGGTGANNATNTSGSFLRSNGTNGSYVASTLILPNSATVNYIPYATSTNTWGQSSGLQYSGSELAVSGTGYFTEGVRINSYCIDMTSESGNYNMNLAGQYLFYANSGANEIQFPDPGTLLGKEIIVKNKSGAALTYVGSGKPKNMAGTTDTQCPDGYVKRYLAQYDCDLDANVWHLVGRNDGTVD